MTAFARRTIRTAAAVIPFVLVAGVGTASAEQIDEAEQIAATVAQVAPPVAGIDLTPARDGFEVETQSSTVEVPASSDEPVVVTTSDGELALGLPVEGVVADLAHDGTVTYPGSEGVDMAVQAHQDGVRLQTIINSPSAPQEFAYSLPEDAAIVDMGPDGLAIFTGEGAEEATAIIEAPWAYDAAGTPVPTHFSLTEDGLVQVVDHSAGDYLYPIVADPTVITGTNWFFGGPFVAVRLNISETVRIMQGGSAAAFVGTLVSWIPTPYTVTAGRIVIALGGGLAAHAASARALNKCVEYRYYYRAYRAYPLYYSGGTCR